MSISKTTLSPLFLEAVEGLLAGQAIHATQPDISFGRTDQNDVVLAEHVISRQHAILKKIEHRLYILDLGSKNGTFLNGTRIKANENIPLNAQDILQIGTTIFHVHAQNVTRNTSTKNPADSHKPSPQPYEHQPGLPSAAAFTPDTKLDKIPTRRKLSPRAILYGSMALVLMLVYVSYEYDKRFKSKSKLKTERQESKINIPESFSPDEETSQKIPTPQEADILITQAQSAIRFEDYRKAIRLFEQVLKVRPEDDKILSYYDVAKKNLYQKIKVHQNIAVIEIEKLNFEKAQDHWIRISELIQGLDPEKYSEAQTQIESIQNMMNKSP